MKRLIAVAVSTLAAAIVLAMVSLRAPAPVGEEPARTWTVSEVQIELGADGVEPYRVQVPKDHEVHLIVHAGPGAPEGVLRITGYEDQVAGVEIGPGVSRELVLRTSRPGDDFAFVVGGDVVGRLFVTGSHLEEGHQ